MQLLKRNKEIIRYLFWGCMTTLVNWGSYSIFAFYYKGNEYKPGNLPKSVFFSSVISWICAMVFSFITNKLFVFRSKDWHVNIFLTEFWKFSSFRLVTGVIEVLTVPFLVNLGLNQSLWGIEGSVSKLFVSAIMVIINYFLGKMVVFKTSSKLVRKKKWKGELQ